MNSDDSDDDFTENETENEVKVNVPSQDDTSSSSSDDEYEQLSKRIKLNKDQIPQLPHTQARERILAFVIMIKTMLIL